jgi:hypothetical protein
MNSPIRDLLDEIRKLCLDSEEARAEIERLLAELFAKHEHFKRHSEQFVLEERPD